MSNIVKNTNGLFRSVFPGQIDSEIDNNLRYSWEGRKVIPGQIITLLPALKYEYIPVIRSQRKLY